MEPNAVVAFQHWMTNDSAGTPAKKKFQALVAGGGVCIVVGALISFTIVGLPLGIPLIVAGILLLAVSPAFKAKHLVRSREQREGDTD